MCVPAVMLTRKQPNGQAAQNERPKNKHDSRSAEAKVECTVLYLGQVRSISTPGSSPNPMELGFALIERTMDSSTSSHRKMELLVCVCCRNYPNNEVK